MTLFNKRREVQTRPLNTKAMELEAVKVGGCGGVYTPPIIENFQFLSATKADFI
jgi:hypothetical protein